MNHDENSGANFKLKYLFTLTNFKMLTQFELASVGRAWLLLA